MTAAPTRCEYFGDYQTPATTARGCASTRATSTSRPPARCTARSSRRASWCPTTPVETRDPKHNYREPGAVLRAHRQADRVRRARDTSTCRSGRRAMRVRTRIAGRSRPAPSRAPAGVAWRRLAVQRRRLDQTEKDGRRYATGIRSLVAMTWNPHVGELYACSTDATTSTGHGRSTSPAGRARCCRPRVLPGHRGFEAAGRTTTTTGCRARSS